MARRIQYGDVEVTKYLSILRVNERSSGEFLGWYDIQDPRLTSQHTRNILANEAERAHLDRFIADHLRR